MDSVSKKTPEERHCIFVDAIPEDEEQQDELNRTMRGPHDPPYDPNAKWMDPPVVPPNGPQKKSSGESQED